jgi:predicted DsbA family dithiol-disulfide isomerase
LDIQVHWLAFPLHPETPEEGQTLEELFAGRNVNIPEVLARLKTLADSLGLPFAERRMTYNSRLAQELGKWAETQEMGDEFHHAMFQAYFVEGQNIAKEAVLVDVIEALNMNIDKAREVIRKRSFQSQVDSDWQRAYALGVTAVPTFVKDGEMLVGAQPYDALERFAIGA